MTDFSFCLVHKSKGPLYSDYFESHPAKTRLGPKTNLNDLNGGDSGFDLFHLRDVFDLADVANRQTFEEKETAIERW